MVKSKEQQREAVNDSLIGFGIIVVSAVNFLVSPWALHTFIEFLVVCVGISFLMNRLENNSQNKNGKPKRN